MGGDEAGWYIIGTSAIFAQHVNHFSHDVPALRLGRETLDQVNALECH